jgi:hypothetical protein
MSQDNGERKRARTKYSCSECGKLAWHTAKGHGDAIEELYNHRQNPYRTPSRARVVIAVAVVGRRRHQAHDCVL